MRRLLYIATLSVFTFCASGCASGREAEPEPSPNLRLKVEERSAAYGHLRELANSAPRRGALVVTPTTLDLNIRRGDESRPFLRLQRHTFNVGCWDSSMQRTGMGHTYTEESDWWLFDDDEHTVALEFTAHDIGAWFWDADRECLVRVLALDRSTIEDSMPHQYYKSEDVQIAYRRNYIFTDYDTSSSKLVKEGDAVADLVSELPGDEQLVVERDIVAIVGPGGRQLFRETFDVDRDWPCYNSQATVFHERDGGVYIVATFEKFGDFGDCSSDNAENRLVTIVAQWDPNQQSFEVTYRSAEEFLRTGVGEEERNAILERRYDVAGGELVVTESWKNREEERLGKICVDRSSTGVCLKSQECQRWSVSEERTTNYLLRSTDGVTFSIADAGSKDLDSRDGCDGGRAP